MPARSGAPSTPPGSWREIHNVFPRARNSLWKCGHISARKLRAFRPKPACPTRSRSVTSLLHRARSASRSKPLPRAVGGSRRFTGEVDKSATGSVNFFGPIFVEHGAKRASWHALNRSVRKERPFPVSPSCAARGEGLVSLSHRARGASRSKPSREAVRGSGRSAGRGDESVTGSVNFFGR